MTINIAIILSLLVVSFSSFAQDSAPNSQKPHKELVRVNSKNRHFLSKVKKDKKEPTDDGVEEITSFEELVALTSGVGHNKIKVTLAKQPKAILLIDQAGNNIVHHLLSEDNIGALTSILNTVGPEVACQAINSRNSSNMGSLHIAAESGSHEAAILLISKGAWVDLPGPSNITAYMMALNKSDVAMAYLLACFGARVTAAPFGKPQQIIAKLKVFSSVCKEFLLDAFTSKEMVTFDDTLITSLLEHLNNLISELYQETKFNENLDKFTADFNADFIAEKNYESKKQNH